MPVTNIICDAWDNSKLYLQAIDNTPRASGPGGSQIPAEGAAVWIMGYNNFPTGTGNRWATTQDEAPELTVQYSAVPGGAGEVSECADAQGPWYDDPADVPGNDPALMADGTYTGVGRVRAHFVAPATATSTGPANGVFVNVAIGMRVADSGLETGTVLPNWAGRKAINNEELSLDEALAHNRSWTRSTYVPGDHMGDPDGHVGNLGDRLILAQAQARIDKQVRKGDSGEFSSTPPQVTGGDLVQYQLAPSLTSGAPTTGVLKDVWIEDCLPASQTYDSASRIPDVVSPGAFPADAKRPACETGETYIRWVIPEHEVNTPIEPIILSVEVSPTVADGVYENTVVIWAEDDASTLEQRTSEAQVQIANIAGIKLEKVALTPVVQVNRTDGSEQELNRWAIRLTNTLPSSDTSGVSDPDIIDVLPAQGEHGTEFNGSFEFVSAEVTQGSDDVRVLYTSDPQVSIDPTAASNGVDGSTTWCDAPAGGNAVSGAGDCPATADQVTGLRVQQAGSYGSGDVIEVEISMVASGNAAGDVYVNRVMASVTGLENPVGPLQRPETVISSTIGDYVWWDFNHNGVQDEFQGSPEQPASGVTVRLTGTDDLGNEVSLETTTDESGQYRFDGLRSSDEDGYVVTFVSPDGSAFTMQHSEDADADSDSDADPTTGSSLPVVLEANSENLTIDAGLLPLGGLQILKNIDGAGAGTFAAGDTLMFDAVCTFEGETVLDAETALIVDGSDVVVSDVFEGLPAYSSCTITETDRGNADDTPAPVTVTIPWDAQAETAGVVTASLTNFYSAGSVELTKELDGDREAIEAASDKVFEILVTCQVKEVTPENETVRADLYSGIVKIRGGQTKYLVDENDEARLLPLGATCFGEEVNDGGATESTIDAPSFEEGVTVTEGTPEELQPLTITAVNTFTDPPVVPEDPTDPEGPRGPELAITGAQTGGLIAMAAGLALLGLLLLIRRRRQDSAPH